MAIKTIDPQASSIVQKNAGVAHLPALIFSTPAYTLEVDQSVQYTGLGVDGLADPTNGDPLVPLVIRFHFFPPSVVFRIVPPAPTAHPC